MPTRDRLERLYRSPEAADFLLAYPGARLGVHAGNVIHADLRGQAEYGNDALAAAARIPTVQQIVADHTSVDDAGLARIGTAHRLSILQLSGCEGVSDAGVASLARLDLPFEHLDLSATCVTPACLALVLGLPRLRELRVGGPAFTALLFEKLDLACAEFVAIRREGERLDIRLKGLDEPGLAPRARPDAIEVGWNTPNDRLEIHRGWIGSSTGHWRLQFDPSVLEELRAVLARLDPGTTWLDQWPLERIAPGSKFMARGSPGPVARRVIDFVSRTNAAAMSSQ